MSDHPPVVLSRCMLTDLHSRAAILLAAGPALARHTERLKAPAAPMRMGQWSPTLTGRAAMDIIVCACLARWDDRASEPVRALEVAK
jgi:hypothetical protein